MPYLTKASRELFKRQPVFLPTRDVNAYSRVISFSSIPIKPKRFPRPHECRAVFLFDTHGRVAVRHFSASRLNDDPLGADHAAGL